MGVQSCANRALIQLSHNSICAERYALGHYLGKRQKFALITFEFALSSVFFAAACQEDNFHTRAM